ncbi:hypothetical protein ACJJTC_018401 [Scirpophaga incertulas]
MAPIPAATSAEKPVPGAKTAMQPAQEHASATPLNLGMGTARCALHSRFDKTIADYLATLKITSNSRARTVLRYATHHRAAAGGQRPLIKSQQERDRHYRARQKSQVDKSTENRY